MGYASEPYIQQTTNRLLQKIIAYCCTGSHWLHVETGRHKKLEKEKRTCLVCPFKLSSPGLPAEVWDAVSSDDDSDGPVEDEHQAIFDCPGNICARGQLQDLNQSHNTTVSHFLHQPQCNRLAKVPRWIRVCSMGLCQVPNIRDIIQSIKLRSSFRFSLDL